MLQRLVGYTRVSTQDQANALEQHAHRLINAGARKVYCEVVSRLSDISDRPALEEIFRLAEIGEIDGVVVTRIDRLTALSGLWEQIIDHFKRYNVKLIGLDDAIDVDSVMGQTMAGIQVVVNKAEVLRLRERIRRGIEHHRKMGRPNYPPFGFKIENGKYVFDTDPFLCLRKQRPQQKNFSGGMSKYDVALDILDIFFEEKSITRACEKIHEKYGIQKFVNKSKPKEEKYYIYSPENPPQQKNRKPERVRGFRFSPEALRLWITNPVLQGHTRYNCRKGNAKLPEDQHIIVYNTHEPLISADTFKDIQQIIEYNRKVRGYGKRRNKKNYTLSGLVYCEKCGYRMVVIGSNRRNGDDYTTRNYYQCKNNTCRVKGCLKAIQTEQQVIKALCSKAKDLAIQISEKVSIEDPKLIELHNQLSSLQSIPGYNPAIQSAIKDLEFQIDNLLKKTKIESDLVKKQYNILLDAGSDEDYWKSLSVELRREFFHSLIGRIVAKGNRLICIDFNF